MASRDLAFLFLITNNAKQYSGPDGAPCVNFGRPKMPICVHIDKGQVLLQCLTNCSTNVLICMTVSVDGHKKGQMCRTICCN